MLSFEQDYQPYKQAPQTQEEDDLVDSFFADHSISEGKMETDVPIYLNDLYYSNTYQQDQQFLPETYLFTPENINNRQTLDFDSNNTSFPQGVCLPTMDPSPHIEEHYNDHNALSLEQAQPITITQQNFGRRSSYIFPMWNEQYNQQQIYNYDCASSMPAPTSEIMSSREVSSRHSQKNYIQAPSFPTADFKLPASKSPIIDSLCVCALHRWGIEVEQHKRPTHGSLAYVEFLVTDFEKYYRASRQICSKLHPTEDIGARVKSLRRWFIHFPKKKERRENTSFRLTVKPSLANKVSEVLDRNEKLFNVRKRRRTQ